MGATRRLSVCYLVPGHHLVPSAGPTRNVLSLARALAALADVTVAFRRVLAPVDAEPFGAVELQPDAAPSGHAADDAAMRDIGLGDVARYMAALHRFARERLPAFDVVLEKNWLLSGYLSRWCRRRGIAAVPVENRVPTVPPFVRNPGKAVRTAAGAWIAGRCLREAPIIIAETVPLQQAIARRWRIAPERIAVIELGVDRSLFHPRDQAAARCRLGWPADATALLYVGILDRAHDLRPVVAALARLQRPAVHLHVVGDGPLRPELEAAARHAAPDAVVFHGAVPHDRVPDFIAAADLCLAPYDPRAFPNGAVGYATLKVREYLAAGRPVALSASGAPTALVRPGETGMLVPHDADAWSALLETLPDRARLRAMGAAAAETPLPTWDDTARAYYAVATRARELAAAEGAR